ncbi:MAG TPA: glycoside hydrolase family 3 N-terminal domain-containing protein [Thermomicrobiales bacterium]|nr:glycoside hydrolase family 3 N-terminal domain-containing protein [Thermomicrobiales bacterium]
MPNHQELAGQSIMFRFHGPVFTDEAREAFKTIRPAGVLFFADNLTSRGQIRALTDELQAEAKALGMPPLLIAVDQEGGIVTRLPVDMVTTPGGMAIGHLDTADIEETSRITARQLREVGINVNFAPTVDVNNNPDNPVIRTRAFGETPDVVSRAAVAFIKGHEDERIVSTVKHFPGHGDTNIDSHHGLPTVDQPIERLRDIELAPFQASIDAGVPGVMSAHIVFPTLDEHPATLSHRILTGLLRDEMDFAGLVFTDSMSMDAISKRYGHEASTVQAKAAGVDVLESNETPDLLVRRHQALVDALDDGTLPASIFEATIARLNAVRERYGIGDVPAFGDADATIRDEVRAIAAKTIHSSKDRFVPLPDSPDTVIIDFQRFRHVEFGDPFNLPRIVRDGLAKKLPHARVITISHEPTGEELVHAKGTAARAKTLVLMTRDANSNPNQAKIGRDLIERANADRIVHVSLRGPYDQGIFGPVDDALLTYGDPAITMQALVDKLAGV